MSKPLISALYSGLRRLDRELEKGTAPESFLINEEEKQKVFVSFGSLENIDKVLPVYVHSLLRFLSVETKTTITQLAEYLLSKV